MNHKHNKRVLDKRSENKVLLREHEDGLVYAQLSEIKSTQSSIHSNIQQLSRNKSGPTVVGGTLETATTIYPCRLWHH